MSVAQRPAVDLQLLITPHQPLNLHTARRHRQQVLQHLPGLPLLRAPGLPCGLHLLHLRLSGLPYRGLLQLCLQFVQTLLTLRHLRLVLL